MSIKTVNALSHYTDWTIGHVHSGALGWVGFISIGAMWISGVMQGLMWRAINPDGSLTYSFIESVQAMHPYYVVRLLGGTLYLVGMLLMAYNIFRTVFGEPLSAIAAEHGAPEDGKVATV